MQLGNLEQWMRVGRVSEEMCRVMKWTETKLRKLGNGE